VDGDALILEIYSVGSVQDDPSSGKNLCVVSMFLRVIDEGVLSKISK
jgi:hypothetical protein